MPGHHPEAGATGEFPIGERSGDRGGLNVALKVDKADKVILWDFGPVPVQWAIMTASEARVLIGGLQKKLAELEALG
jgi:hypothetical protein